MKKEKGATNLTKTTIGPGPMAWLAQHSFGPSSGDEAGAECQHDKRGKGRNNVPGHMRERYQSS